MKRWKVYNKFTLTTYNLVISNVLERQIVKTQQFLLS